MKNETNEEREEARKKLLDIFERNDKAVYTILRHVSRSGTMRVIDVCVIENNKPIRISWETERLLSLKPHPRYNGVKIKGGGMDMGFHLVYRLSQELYGAKNGYTLTQRWL